MKEEPEVGWSDERSRRPRPGDSRRGSLEAVHGRNETCPLENGCWINPENRWDVTTDPENYAILCVQ